MRTSTRVPTLFRKRNITRFLVGLCAVPYLLVVGCADGAAPSAPRALAAERVPPSMRREDPGIVRREIAPQATDADINIALDPHLVRLSASNHANGRLLVFLASSRVPPSTAEIFQREAALLGYRVIGLSYPNTPGLASFCPPSANPQACYENVRLQVITGEPQTGFVSVNRANSIDNRLTKLLEYLDRVFPGEAWSQFLDDDGNVKWNKIVVAGHSQGAGHAAMIAKLRTVHRVVMLSGITDGVGLQAAQWVTIGATPATRYYGLAHAKDAQFIGYDFANWAALGLDEFGPATAPEISAPPYDGSHMLVTDVLPQTGSYAAPAPHASTGVDFAVALDALGVPVLRDAWRYMMGYCPNGSTGLGGGADVVPACQQKSSLVGAR